MGVPTSAIVIFFDARRLPEPVNRGRFTSKHGAVRECRPNKTSSRLGERSKLGNAAPSGERALKSNSDARLEDDAAPKHFPHTPSERKDACNVVDVFRFCQPFA